ENVKTVKANCKECKLSANSNISQLITNVSFPYIPPPQILGEGKNMSRQQPPSAVSSPRLLASAIGVAITAGSAGHMVQAAEETQQKTSGKA
ncbi:hypothetical protein SB758_34910, partial [Burkholderia sp. SIMBA_013]